MIIEAAELLGNTTVVARQTIENSRRLIAEAVRAAWPRVRMLEEQAY